MTSGGKVRPAIRDFVRQRAAGLCEYCHTSERWQYVPFTMDHVIPLSRGGTDEPDNLALSCFHCNRRKADRTMVVDPVSGREVPLYNPRVDNWQDHFICSLGIGVVYRQMWGGLAIRLTPNTRYAGLSRQIPKSHFIWSNDGLQIVGVTTAGRAMVIALELNRERVINIRSADRAVGRHPPVHDPVQKA